MSGARAQPAVIAMEDLHWADPTTLDLLRGFAERGALAPLFFVITARPEFRAPWGMRSHHSTISLAPLDRSQVRHMVGELAARDALPKEVVDSLTERTGGVPLFVEEVTRLLLERGEHGGMEAIPPTLQQSLMARLDRLGSAREVAQIGAVIGRGFSYPLIRAVADMEDTALQTALERLAEADILLVQGLPPESEYRFKHMLIQDAAYENLLRSRRQFLHRRVGQTIESRFAEIAESQPELIAQHYTAAAMPEQAIPYWMKAGERALARSAYREPLAYFDRALSLARSLPESPARTRQILDLLFLLGETHSRNRNVSEALQTFKEAFELARAVDSPADLARAAVGASRSRNLYRRPGFGIASADGGSPRCAWRCRNRRAQPVTQSVQLPIMDVGQLRAGGCAEPSGTRSSATAWRPRRALSRTALSGAGFYPGPTLPRRAVPDAPAVDCRAA